MEYREKLLNALLPKIGLFESLSQKSDVITTLKKHIHEIVDWDEQYPNIEKQYNVGEYPHTDYKIAKELLVHYLNEFTPFGLPICNTIIQYDSMVWMGPTKCPFPFLSILVASIMVRYEPESFKYINNMQTSGINDLTNRLQSANLFERVGTGHWGVIKTRYAEHIKYLGYVLKRWPEDKNPQTKVQATRLFGVLTLDGGGFEPIIERLLYD